MNKPLSILRKEYIEKICDVTNESGLPAFVIVDVLAKVLSNMQREAANELKRDEALYRKSLQDVKQNGTN